MPFIYANNLSADEAGKYLEDIYNSIIFKDVAARHTVFESKFRNKKI